MKKRIATLLALTLIIALLLPGTLAWADGKTMDICAHEVTKEMRKAIVRKLKASAFDVEKCTPMDIAYVTRGGVSVKQIDPKTMGSKVQEGLFFSGEVMDIDGISGGYNLQFAWESGRAAGIAAAEYSQA